MIYIFYLVISTLFFVSSNAGPLDFKNCGKSQIDYISLTGCEFEQKYCQFPRGGPIQLNMTFSIPEDTEKLDILIEYLSPIFQTRFPVLLPESNGCDSVSDGCPIRAGKIYTFSHKGNIPKYTPKFKGTLFASLVGDYGVISCVEFTGQVV